MRRSSGHSALSSGAPEDIKECNDLYVGDAVAASDSLSQVTTFSSSGWDCRAVLYQVSAVMPAKEAVPSPLRMPRTLS